MQEPQDNLLEKDKLLIVDDIELNRAILRELFQDNYTILEAENGRQALELIKEHQNDIAALLLDLIMPEMDGVQVLKNLNRNGWINLFPVILITSENSEDIILLGYDLGASDIIAKPFKPGVVRRRVLNNIELLDHRQRLKEMVHEKTIALEQANSLLLEQAAALAEANILLKEQAAQLKENNDFIIDALSTIVEFRDGESGAHVKRMRRITKILMTALSDQYPEYRMSTEQIETISSAASLHDIGKIAIPDAVLLKPGRLTPEEFEIMKTHTLRGCELLENMHYNKNQEYYTYSYEICRHHHERWDGKGYPDGLKGDEIPIWSQVVSIADVYEALISKRIYKDAFSHEEAVRMIVEGECGVFNPSLTQCFLQIAGKLKTELAQQ